MGLSWDHRNRIRTTALAIAFFVAVALTLPTSSPSSANPSLLVPVIVREVPGSGETPENLVEQFGGTVGDQLQIIGGFAAEIPSDMILTLAADPAVYSVTPDTTVRLLDFGAEFATESPDTFTRGSYVDAAYDDDDAEDLELVQPDTDHDADDLELEQPDTDHDADDLELEQPGTNLTISTLFGNSIALSPSLMPSSTLSLRAASLTAPPGWMALVNDATGAMDYWAKGYTGTGVDVALIDSGISSVAGINLAGKVVNGLDISFESQADNLRYLDTYGHGTHMAGIIAGRDSLTDPLQAQKDGEFVGVAPGARILNVKVADSNGAVDVSQVIAAVDWVVQHRNDNGLNIRVLNLSFGTNGTQQYTLDPLVYAVQQAWESGIVVVVAAGNDGNAAALRNPAFNPFVIAVGASDTGGTERSSDDFVTDFSNCGTSVRHVDLVAPGRSIESLRVPGSSADAKYPSAVVDTRFFKGSGTSQSAAIVSGAAALVINQRPGITPDQVKALLMKSAKRLDSSSSTCQGAGTLSLGKALKTKTPRASQEFNAPSGTGLLDLARGSAKLIDGTVVLDGEQDIFGVEFDSASWSTAAAQSASWSGGTWNGSSWSGASWSSASWSGASWSSASWSSASWSGASWSSASWSSASWSGASWSSASWSGKSWSSASWSSNVWSSKSWGTALTTMSES
jgi:serine protease AprX